MSVQQHPTYCPSEYRRIEDHGGSSRHDWRLWKREPRYAPEEGAPAGGWPQTAWHEVWYCTSCRSIEERTVDYEALA